MENQGMKAALEPEARRAGGGKAAFMSAGSEAPEIPRRRRFTAEYKQQILREFDQCHEPGQKGLILRREGLYSTTVAYWRQRRRNMGSKSKKASRSVDTKNELARLQRENIRLKAQLEKAHKLLEIQKKMAEFVESWEKKSSAENPSE